MFCLSTKTQRSLDYFVSIIMVFLVVTKSYDIRLIIGKNVSIVTDAFLYNYTE